MLPASRPVPAITQGALALQFQVAPDLPAVPEVPAPPALRLVGHRDDDDGHLPDVHLWAARLTQAVAEVMSGDRPLGQLIRWTDGTVYADLHRRVSLLGLVTTASIRTSADRATVRSVHVCRPAPRVAEIAAHLRHGGRSRAAALRLEAHGSHWLCTALHLG